MQGMQYNPGIKTIEGELCKAMCAAGCISPQNARDPSKVCAILAHSFGTQGADDMPQ